MDKNKKQQNIEPLKENILHGNILFLLAVHLTEHKAATDIMLYTHWHEELELLYIQEGSMLLQMDTESIVVNKGDTIILPPNVIHGASRYNNCPCDFYAIVFHPSFINSSLNDIIQQHYIAPFFTETSKSFYYFKENNLEVRERIQQNITAIIDAYSLKNYGYELFIKSSILQILFYVIESYSDVIKCSTKYDMVTTQRMKKILAFLEEHYQQPYSLAEWASCIGLSKEQFCRVFKKHFNKTPINYLMNYRIRKAADLLLNTNLPIIDIAFESGFESANYFTIVFKNKTKTTPTDFRNKSKNLQTNSK